MRRIFVPEEEHIIGKSIKLHKDELRNMYSYQNVLKGIK
jgi:hypothetical protein